VERVSSTTTTTTTTTEAAATIVTAPEAMLLLPPSRTGLVEWVEWEDVEGEKSGDSKTDV
jgi:hypothetical protein